MVRKCILAAVLACSATQASAEVQEGRYSLSPVIGGYTFEGDQHLRTRPMYGLRLGYDYTRHVGVEALVDYVATESTIDGTSTDIFSYGIEGLYHFMPESNLVPYLAAGGRFIADYRVKTETYPGVSYGAGLKYFLTPDVALRADLRHIIIFDSVENELSYSAGLSWFFGGTKKPAPAPVQAVAVPAPKPVEPPAAPKAPADEDGDGVADAADRCPGTPKGVKVDAAGCPLDTDGDGVYDYQDKCPGTPKGVKVDASGCPLDTDGDGVYDYLDKCPGTPKGVKVDAAGCPVDTDKDGVYDSSDKCPGTPAGVKVDASGCPLDTDGDGVYDYQDKCPDTPKGVKVDKAGCPLDSDGDGVYDHLDKCPGTPAGVKVDMAGCEMRPKITLNLEFDQGKSDIKPKYRENIAVVGEFMKKYPEVKVTITGHTNSTGSPKYNNPLALSRANSVKKYLVEKFGIEPSRIKAEGYGADRPIASNATAEGRSRNRRIEATFSE